MPAVQGLRHAYLYQQSSQNNQLAEVFIVLVTDSKIMLYDLRKQEVVNKISFETPLVAVSKHCDKMALAVGDDIVLFDISQFSPLFVVKR